MATQPMLTRRCRVCLDWIDAKESVDLKVPLFDCASENIFNVIMNTSAKTISLLEVFNECTQLHVLLDDFEVGERCDWEGCRYLCITCSCELQRAYRFILKARLSHAALCEQIKSNTVQHGVNQNDTENEVGFIETLDEDFEQEELGTYLKSSKSNQASPIHHVEQALADIFGFDSRDEDQNEPPIKYLKTNVKEEIEDIDLKLDDVGRKHGENYLRQKIDVSLEDNYSKLNFEECDVKNNDANATDSDGADATSIEVRLMDEEDEIDLSCQDMLDFKCELCVAKFDFQRDLMLHYKHTHDKNDLHYTCSNCNQRFFTKSSLNTHIRQIHQNCEYIDCLQCGRTVLKSFFKVHQRRHKKQKSFLCCECPRTFSSNYTLKKHQHTHSKDRDRNIECEQCERRFYTIEAFRTHQVTHQDPKERETYNCSMCEKTFMRQTNLKLHMQMHRGETIDCPHCGKQFVRRKDLEIHIRFHTGEFPYVCKTCNRRFAIKSHLTAHEKKHKGIKYQCSQCQKQFLNVAGLRQHAFEHTGMPLSCQICQKGFPTKFKVRRHIRSVHHYIFNSSEPQDTEKYIKQNGKSVADRITILEVPTQPETAADDIYEMEILEEEVDDLVEFIIEEV